MNNITYQDIVNANKSITTVDVKGKQYAEVNQRIKAFRMVYPTGFITTEMLSNENGVCIIKASVGFYDDNGNLRLIGTGSAYEKEGSTFINKTSYIENCETSAVGRALGMAGFGIDTSVASAEEVQTAIANQNADAKITEDQIAFLRNVYSTEEKYAKLLNYNHITQIEDMPYNKAQDLIDKIIRMNNERSANNA